MTMSTGSASSGALKYQATDKFAFSPRFETLADGSRFVTGGTERVSEHHADRGVQGARRA